MSTTTKKQHHSQKHFIGLTSRKNSGIWSGILQKFIAKFHIDLMGHNANVHSHQITTSLHRLRQKSFIGLTSWKDSGIWCIITAYILQKCIAKLHIGLMGHDANVHNPQLTTSLHRFWQKKFYRNYKPKGLWHLIWHIVKMYFKIAHCVNELQCKSLQNPT